ncbi:MAG: glycosyltransferase [Deltaproteobacteria bacterium]|nr:glycosyltransferase [Deltaproteobacteria bacterium]MBF0507430.1 glycosyltransferase [Deltaproteobacteria bacterium]
MAPGKAQQGPGHDQGKRIQVVVLVSTLVMGGAEQMLMALLQGLNRERFQVLVYFLKEPGILGQEIPKLGYPIRTNILKGYGDIAVIPRLARLLIKDRADIVLLLNHRDTIFFGVTAAKLAGVRGVINWHHDTAKRYSMHRLTMLGRRVFHLLGVDRVVAVAQGHKEYLIKSEGISRSKIEVIYNGVNPEKCHSSLTVSEAKRRLGIPLESLVVSMISVLRPDKAHDVLLQAAKIVLRDFPTAYFIIVGDGPRKGALEDLAKGLGLAGHVLFLGFRRDIADILRAVDINVLSTKPEQETLSVAVIEAMAAGIPSVCTDVGFMREIVHSGENGFLVRLGDPQDLAQKIMVIFGDEELRRKMGAASQKAVQAGLTVKQMVTGFENLFCTLAGDSQVERIQPC